MINVIKKMLSENSNHLYKSINLQTSLVLSDDFDSLDKVEFVMALEEHFNIEIPDDDLYSWQTLQDVVDWFNDVSIVEIRND